MYNPPFAKILLFRAFGEILTRSHCFHTLLVKTKEHYFIWSFRWGDKFRWIYIIRIFNRKACFDNEAVVLLLIPLAYKVRITHNIYNKMNSPHIWGPLGVGSCLLDLKIKTALVLIPPNWKDLTKIQHLKGLICPVSTRRICDVKSWSKFRRSDFADTKKCYGV